MAPEMPPVPLESGQLAIADGPTTPVKSSVSQPEDIASPSIVSELAKELKVESPASAKNHTVPAPATPEAKDVVTPLLGILPPSTRPQKRSRLVAKGQSTLSSKEKTSVGTEDDDDEKGGE